MAIISRTASRRSSPPLTVLPVRSSLGRRLFCRFSDQTPALKCVKTDDLHRTCPHWGKNTATLSVSRTVWFATKSKTTNGLVLFACNDTNRHKCPNLPKLKPAIAQHDNDAAGRPDPVDDPAPGPS